MMCEVVRREHDVRVGRAHMGVAVDADGVGSAFARGQGHVSLFHAPGAAGSKSRLLAYATVPFCHKL